jgi:undecaprenyl-diphosphatase
MHTIVILIAQYLLFILIGIGGIYWLRQDKAAKIKIAFIGLIGAVIALMLMKIGAALFYDPRPFVTHNVVPYFHHVADNGFPSDHTSLAAVLAVTLFFASRKLGIALFIGAIFVGGSRVIAHVHSPIDIIGGLVIGIVSVYASHSLYRLWQKKRQHSQVT